jgi:HK97 family phage portal protein
MWPFKRKNPKIKKKDSKAQVAIVTTGGSGVKWPERRYDVFAKETWLKNVIAFRCMDKIAKAVASIPWDMFKKRPDGSRENMPEHAFKPVLKRANPQESWSYFVMKAIDFLMMAGNSYLEKVSPSTGPNAGMPKEIYTLRPDRMKIIVDTTTGRRKAYEYDAGQGKKVRWDVNPVTGDCDIRQLQTFHPLDDWYGAAITETAAYEIDTSNEATLWNKKILENSGSSGHVFIITGDKEDVNSEGSFWSDDQYDRFKKQIDEQYSGALNAGKNLVIEGGKGTTMKPLGFSLKDLDFNEGQLALARRICTAYGVPPMLIGIPGSDTYNNVREANLAFWEETVLYYAGYFRDEMNAWLFPKENSVFLDYILDEISGLSLRRDSRWSKANDSDFLSVNEKREMVGKETWGEEGDVILVPVNMIPLGMDITQEEKSLKKAGYTDEEIGDILNYGKMKVVK